MCYAYIKDPATAREGSAKRLAPIDQETGAPAMPATESRAETEQQAVGRFLDKIRRILASQKSKREEATSA